MWSDAFDLIAIIGAHSTWVVGMTWTGQQLLSVSNDGLLKVWDIDKESQTRTFKDSSDELYCCFCFGSYMASAGLDCTLRIYGAVAEGDATGAHVRGPRFFLYRLIYRKR